MAKLILVFTELEHTGLGHNPQPYQRHTHARTCKEIGLDTTSLVNQIEE